MKYKVYLGNRSSGMWLLTKERIKESLRQGKPTYLFRKNGIRKIEKEEDLWRD